jgi:phosphoglycolate phosphatase
MAIGGILFDKDGTLIDFPATWLPVLKALALEFSGGHQPLADELLIVAGYDRERDQLRGGSIWAAGNTMDLVRAWKPGLRPAEEAEWRAFVDDFCSEHAPGSAVPVIALEPLFSELEAAGLKLGIATNDNTRSARLTVERLGIAHHFAAILGYDAVTQAKPAADPVLAFCGMAALKPEQVAVVGDNLHDLEMARAAGAGLAIGVLSGTSAIDELGPHADHVIASIAELPEVLGLRRRK